MTTTAVKVLQNAHDLSVLRDNVRNEPTGPGIGIREKVLLCTGGGCMASGALAIRDALKKALEDNGLAERVRIVCTGCLGPCAGGPALIIGSDRTFYQKLTPADAVTIVKEHILAGKIVDRLTWNQNGSTVPTPLQTDLPFFNRQTKVVLRNCGEIDPVRIEEYIGRDGFQGLSKALDSMTPEQVIEQVKISGLRGRGGAGFPTATKWLYAREAKGETKYIICNGDEGDPGAFMDRSVLEGDPQSVIEGMALAGFAIGASQGVVYVRAEYPLAVERLK